MTLQLSWSASRRTRRIPPSDYPSIGTQVSCTVRVSGTTNFLEAVSKLEDAQRMAGDSSAKTNKLYDRRSDPIKLD